MYILTLHVLQNYSLLNTSDDIYIKELKYIYGIYIITIYINIQLEYYICVYN